jgi:hypothetical protein
MNYTFHQSTKEEGKSLLLEKHYLHSINIPFDITFALKDGDRIVGIAVFSKVAFPLTARKYGTTKDRMIELRRLVCVDDTPRNTESFFIGSCLRWLSQNMDYDFVLSYADGKVGHSGTIYRATNFQFMGVANGKNVFLFGLKKHSRKHLTNLVGRI